MIAQAIQQAVQTAKTNMGDLLRTAVLKHCTGRTYDTGTGRYTLTYADQNIDYVNDKFSYQEMQAEDYVQTDLKILVFNTDNVVLIDTDDSVTMDGITYAVRKVNPVYVGGFKVVYEVVLRT